MLYDKYKRERQHLNGGHKIIKKIDLNEQCKYKMQIIDKKKNKNDREKHTLHAQHADKNHGNINNKK